MIGRNILLKASTIENQILVFVSCLGKRMMEQQYEACVQFTFQAI